MRLKYETLLILVGMIIAILSICGYGYYTGLNALIPIALILCIAARLNSSRKLGVVGITAIIAYLFLSSITIAPASADEAHSQTEITDKADDDSNPFGPSENPFGETSVDPDRPKLIEIDGSELNLRLRLFVDRQNVEAGEPFEIATCLIAKKSKKPILVHRISQRVEKYSLEKEVIHKTPMGTYTEQEILQDFNFKVKGWGCIVGYFPTRERTSHVSEVTIDTSGHYWFTVDWIIEIDGKRYCLTSKPLHIKASAKSDKPRPFGVSK